MFHRKQTAMTCNCRNPNSVNNQSSRIYWLGPGNVLSKMAHKAWNAQIMRSFIVMLRHHIQNHFRAQHLLILNENGFAEQVRIKPLQDGHDHFLLVQFHGQLGIWKWCGHPQNDGQQIMQNMAILKWWERKAAKKNHAVVVFFHITTLKIRGIPRWPIPGVETCVFCEVRKADNFMPRHHSLPITPLCSWEQKTSLTNAPHFKRLFNWLGKNFRSNSMILFMQLLVFLVLGFQVHICNNAAPWHLMRW